MCTNFFLEDEYWCGGLGWVLHDHLGQMCLASLKFVLNCQKVKLLKAMVICFGLETLSSISVPNIMVEFNCLEVISLLNDVTVDFSEVSFFIEAKERGGELGVVPFSHACHNHNLLAQRVPHKVLEDQKSSILSTPYRKWFTSIMSLDIFV